MTLIEELIARALIELGEEVVRALLTELLAHPDPKAAGIRAAAMAAGEAALIASRNAGKPRR